MKRYKSVLRESFKKGDTVKMKKGRYKDLIGIIIEEFMPGWFEVNFPDKAKMGINSHTDVQEKEIEKIKKKK